jgi:hypothetical protein
MQEKHLFEYAVIRVVPRVEREEFMNVGVILYCASQKYLNVVFNVNEELFNAFKSELELSVVTANLKAIAIICEGGTNCGPIGNLDIASRFRWLTATRSTVVQASKVHPGFCKDAAEMLADLHQNLVL